VSKFIFLLKALIAELEQENKFGSLLKALTAKLEQESGQAAGMHVKP
jgi:hypothetical protein